MNKKRTVLLFVLIIVIFMAGTFLMPDKEFSKAEKRTLTTRKSFSHVSLMDKSFQKTSKDYVSDQFLGRDKFVKLYGNFQRLMGNKKIEDVYFGDDYLFEEYNKTSEEKIAEMANSINKFASKNPKVNTDVLIAPTQAGILEDNLPSFAPKGLQSQDINNFYKLLEKNISKINVYDAFLNKIEKDDKNLYYHSDHHWTSYGAKTAFDIYAKKNKLTKGLNEYESLTVKNDFYGTLSAKTGIYSYPDEIVVYLNKNKKDVVKVKYSDLDKTEYTLYKPHMLESDSAYNIFMGGNHPLVKIDTASTSGKNILVIKDSYANSFIPFLTPYYSTITVVDPRYYFESINELMDLRDITDVLFLYNATTFFKDESLEDALLS